MTPPPRRFDLAGLGLLDDIPPAEIVCGELTLLVRPFESLAPTEVGQLQALGSTFSELTAKVGKRFPDEAESVEIASVADQLIALTLVDSDAVPPLGLLQRIALVGLIMDVARQGVDAGAAAKKKWSQEHLSGSSTPASSPPAATPGPASRTGSRRSRSRS